MSLALLFQYLILNVFRMLIHPSSGACDLFVELFHGLFCSVRIEVIALACLFSGECSAVTTKHSPLNKHANAITSILTEQNNP